jgi:hypothetical protein
MAAADADDAYVMDLSERHLSSRGLHDALARLQNVLHAEDQRDGVAAARPLELLCAGNDVAKFALPAAERPQRPAPPQRPHEREPPSRQESYAELHRSQGGLMDMMMGWQDDEATEEDEADAYVEPPPPPPPPTVAPPLSDRIIVLDLAGNRLGPDAAPSMKALSSLRRLRSLNLADNGLESCGGLAALVTLEALFLQKNYLRSADGLWGLARLSALDLRENNIRSVTALRPLSCNAALRSLDVRGNPLCDDAPKAKDARARLRSVLVRLARLGVGPDARDAAPSTATTTTLADIKPAVAGGDSYAGTHRRQVERRQPSQTGTVRSRPQTGTVRSRPAPPRRRRAPSPPPPPPPELSRELSPETPAREAARREALADLPWRQPPNPLPRWMLEREVGTAAADVVVRTRRGAARKDVRTRRRDVRTRPVAAPPVGAVDEILGAVERVVSMHESGRHYSSVNARANPRPFAV